MSDTTSTLDDWLEIGKVVAPQGLGGELRVYPDSDFPERFLEPGDRWLWPVGAPAPQPVRLLTGRWLPKVGLYVLRLAEVGDRSAAEALRGAKLLVPASSRPPLEPGEYHLGDLIGLQVIDRTEGRAIGQVVGLVTAAQDLLEVRLEEGERLVLIPFVEAIVPVVDLAAGRVEIVPPPGLLAL